MTNVRELHDAAMKFAQQAMVAREEGQATVAERYARDAYELESRAAGMVRLDKEPEPTRSILYSSAASLAFQCKNYDESIRLIGQGLCGFPPPQVKGELLALLEQVNFEAQLKERGLALSSDDLDLSIKGDDVGFGLVIYDEFAKRIESLYSILTRTVQRKQGRQYQASGPIAGMYKYFVPALLAPRAGSFSISFKLAALADSQAPLFVNASEIIEDILAGMEHVESGNMAGLRDLIVEDPYRVNFVAMARRIAPDGEKVSHVALSSKKKTVGLTRLPTDISVVSEVERGETSILRPKEIIGLLDVAKSRKVQYFEVTAEDKRAQRIHVAEGMDDLVRSFFKQRVKISGIYDARKRLTYLQNIVAAEE